MRKFETFKQMAKAIASCEEENGRRGEALIEFSLNFAIHLLKIKGESKPSKSEKRIVREYLSDFFAINLTAADRLIIERRKKVGYDVPFYKINPLKV